jgi:hypothetical protein
MVKAMSILIINIYYECGNKTVGSIPPGTFDKMRICLCPPSQFRKSTPRLQLHFQPTPYFFTCTFTSRYRCKISVFIPLSPYCIYSRLLILFFTILDGLHESRNDCLCHTLYRSFTYSFTFCFTLRNNAYFPGHISSQHMPFVFRHHRNRLYSTSVTIPGSNIFIYQ